VGLYVSLLLKIIIHEKFLAEGQWGFVLFMHTPFDAELPIFDLVTQVGEMHVSWSKATPGSAPCRLQAISLLVYKSLQGLAPPYLGDDCTLDLWLPLTSFAAVYVRTHASSRGPVPVFVTGVYPLPTPGSGTAYRRICDGQPLSLANSVD